MFRTEECRRQHPDNSEKCAGIIASYRFTEKGKTVREKRKQIQVNGNAEEIDCTFQS